MCHNYRRSLSLWFNVVLASCLAIFFVWLGYAGRKELASNPTTSMVALGLLTAIFLTIFLTLVYGFSFSICLDSESIRQVALLNRQCSIRHSEIVKVVEKNEDGVTYVVVYGPTSRIEFSSAISGFHSLLGTLKHYEELNQKRRSIERDSEIYRLINKLKGSRFDRRHHYPEILLQKGPPIDVADLVKLDAIQLAGMLPELFELSSHSEDVSWFLSVTLEPEVTDTSAILRQVGLLYAEGSVEDIRLLSSLTKDRDAEHG